MKDFAKSIVCNSVTEKEFNTEADLRRWCMDHNYTYTPVGGGYYRLENDKPGSNRPDLEAHVKAGNSRVGNADPRIASIKSKLPMLEKQNDVGGLKDVASFVEDSIKDLRKRLDQLEKDYNAAKNDYNDWLDLRSKVQASYQLASRK